VAPPEPTQQLRDRGPVTRDTTTERVGTQNPEGVFLEPDPVELTDCFLVLDPKRTAKLRELADDPRQGEKADRFFDLWREIEATFHLSDIGLSEFLELPPQTQTDILQCWVDRAGWIGITPEILLPRLAAFPLVGDVTSDPWFLDAPPIDWTQHPAPVQAETPAPPVVSTRWREGARVLMEALGRMDCPPSRILVALALLSFANKEGKAWPSYATLANLTNLARSTVQDSIRWLLDHQVIEVIEPPEPHASARYRLILLEGQER